MGVFTQKQAAYTPRLDGTAPQSTLVGSSGPELAGNPDEWRIELRRLPIGHRGHAVLVMLGPNGEMKELNGIAKSRNTDELTGFGRDGMWLYAHDGPRYAAGSEPMAVVASGSYDKINGLWGRGLRAAAEINQKNYDYKGHDPAYEFGGSGGEIQNSNSVAFTLGKAMGLDLDSAIRRARMERTFSGWGRDLLDRSYKPYVAPPQFAVRDTP
ncbi:MAG: hypothetical protein J0J01_25515 [Reyranella sp.]|uniref:hypothetical protein n=1 Tax=Reyranella sp. TaxID=1929291 RepID=UPI001ACA997F|nr:hypothetical protein [Reyranella sp.]MBN9090284.1 hypothetical protein [Reyranella sp.]